VDFFSDRAGAHEGFEYFSDFAEPVADFLFSLGADPHLRSRVVQQAGLASWYGRHWRGRKTASGMVFDERQLTAASLVLPLATRARVTNLQNGRSVDVLVNDRGPYAGNRVMDLSERAATMLGMTKSGLAQVVIRVHLAQAVSARAG